MKRPRNAALTQQRILDAATTEFAAMGFDGARVDQIARRANANKNLLYLYFGGKDDLFQSVLERAYEAMRKAQHDARLRTECEPEEGMEELVRSTFRAFLANPEIIRLAISENLLEARHLKGSTKVRELFDPLLATLGELLERGVERRVFRPGIDPIDLYVSIVSLCSYYLSNQHTLSVLLKTKVASRSRQKRRESHVVELVLRFVRP